MHQKFLFSKTQQLIILMREISLKKKKVILEPCNFKSERTREIINATLSHEKILSPRTEKLDTLPHYHTFSYSC